jgi:hypothetical protein
MRRPENRMAIAAEKVGTVLVGDEQEKIRTGRFRHCDALVHSCDNSGEPADA